MTSGTAFVVRRATSADAEKMLFIWQETADMLAKGDSRFMLLPGTADRWRASLHEWLQRDDVAVFVAESTVKEGHVLGYVVGAVVSNLPILQPERLGFVSELAVDSHGKAGGIGRGLFDALKGWFRERGVTNVEARVPHHHAIAQAFWRALGASEIYQAMWLKLQ